MAGEEEAVAPVAAQAETKHVDVHEQRQEQAIKLAWFLLIGGAAALAAAKAAMWVDAYQNLSPDLEFILRFWGTWAAGIGLVFMGAAHAKVAVLTRALIVGLGVLVLYFAA